MATSGFKIKVGLDSTAAERGLSRIGRSAGRLNKRMGRLVGSGLKFGAGIAAATTAMAAFAAVKFIKDSSKAAADYEKMSLGFKGFLGTAEKAAERMRAIEKMSMATPFEPKELAAASKKLQALGGDTAAIGEGLEMVGDAAAMTGESLDMIARNVGLLFQGLTAGGEVGEATNMLQQTVKGFASVKGEITEAVAAMRKGDRAFMSSAEALKLIQKGFAETKGGMADLASSFGGKASTMLGHLDMLRIAFGEGINRGLSTGLDAMNDQLPKWMEQSKALGDTIGLGISEAIKGNSRLLELQMAWLMQKLAQIGGAVFVQALGGVFRTLIPNLITRLFDIPGMEALMAIAQPATWLAFKKMQTGPADIPQVPLDDLLAESAKVVGIQETEEKIKELVEETKKTNRILREKKEMKEYQKMVYGTLTYTMD